jgi:uncharacterized protein (TIGR00730 family)
MHENAHKKIVNLPAKDLPIKPITLNEIDEEIKKRVSLIDEEFTRGFNFIKNQKKSITMFGSARFSEDNEHYKRARNISYKLAKLGYSILSGGGPGIMEAANRGAFEAEGKSLGLNIKLPHEQSRNPYITDFEDFYYFFIRKVMMTFSAEAYLFFPGGFGTLDEFFEIITLVQTNKIEWVPVILVGNEYWNKLDGFIKDEMYARNKAVDADDMKLYTITEDEDKIIEIVKKAPIRTDMRIHHTHDNDGTQK